MKKDKMFAMRMSTADYDRIQNKAQLSGMTMTDFLTLSALGKENYCGEWLGRCHRTAESYREESEPPDRALQYGQDYLPRPYRHKTELWSSVRFHLRPDGQRGVSLWQSSPPSKKKRRAEPP